MAGRKAAASSAAAIAPATRRNTRANPTNSPLKSLDNIKPKSQRARKQPQAKASNPPTIKNPGAVAEASSSEDADRYLSNADPARIPTPAHAHTPSADLEVAVGASNDDDVDNNAQTSSTPTPTQRPQSSGVRPYMDGGHSAKLNKKRKHDESSHDEVDNGDDTPLPRSTKRPRYRNADQLFQAIDKKNSLLNTTPSTTPGRKPLSTHIPSAKTHSQKTLIRRRVSNTPPLAGQNHIGRSGSLDDSIIFSDIDNTPPHLKKRTRDSDAGLDINARLDAHFGYTQEELAAAARNAKGSASARSIVDSETTSRNISENNVSKEWRTNTTGPTFENKTTSANIQKNDLPMAYHPVTSKFSVGRKPLGPRSAIIAEGKKDTEKMPDDMNVRRDFAMKECGVEIPRLPYTATGLHHSYGSTYMDSYQDDDEDEFDVHGSGNITMQDHRKQMKSAKDFLETTRGRKAKSNPTTPLSKDSNSLSLQSHTTHSTTTRPSTVNISSSSSSSSPSPSPSPSLSSIEKIVAALITNQKTLASLISWSTKLTEDPTSYIPSPAEFAMIVAENESLRASYPQNGNKKPSNSLAASRGAVDMANGTSLEAFNRSAEAAGDDLPPDTPTKVSSSAQQSRGGWLSGLTSAAKLAAVPLSYFGGSRQTSISPTKSDHAGSSLVSDTPNVENTTFPQTFDMAPPPSPQTSGFAPHPIPAPRYPGRLPSAMTPRSILKRSSTLTQTEKKKSVEWGAIHTKTAFSPVNQYSPQYDARGNLVWTLEALQAYHRQKDEEEAESEMDRELKEQRRASRREYLEECQAQEKERQREQATAREASRQATVQDAPDYDEPAQPGGKRKRSQYPEDPIPATKYYIPTADERPSMPGTYGMPDFSDSSDDEGDSSMDASSPVAAPRQLTPRFGPGSIMANNRFNLAADADLAKAQEEENTRLAAVAEAAADAGILAKAQEEDNRRLTAVAEAATEAATVTKSTAAASDAEVAPAATPMKEKAVSHQTPRPKYKPAVPSKLSETYNAPVEEDKENKMPLMKEKWRASAEESMAVFAPDVRAAAEAAVEIEESKTELHQEMAEDEMRFDSVVWGATDQYFQ